MVGLALTGSLNLLKGLLVYYIIPSITKLTSPFQEINYESTDWCNLKRKSRILDTRQHESSPVIPTFRRLRKQEDCHEFEISLGYIVSIRTLYIRKKKLDLFPT